MNTYRSPLRGTHQMLRAGAAVLVLLFGSLVVPVASQRTGSAVHPLASLQRQSGWLYLALLDVESQEWASVVRWEVVQRRSGRRGTIPGPRDVLRMTREMDVQIVDYQERGEEHYLVSPGNRVRRLADLTGVKLPPGTKVVILEISEDTPVGGAQSIWARVGIP